MFVFTARFLSELLLRPHHYSPRPCLYLVLLGEHPEEIQEPTYFTEQGEYKVDASGSKR